MGVVFGLWVTDAPFQDEETRAFIVKIHGRVRASLGVAVGVRGYTLLYVVAVTCPILKWKVPS
jgi:hypothetical protein